MACIACRHRKLRCDKTQPTCSTCTKTGRRCTYDAEPKKRGPKKRNLRALEERLAFLEQERERGIKSSPEKAGAASELTAASLGPKDFEAEKEGDIDPVVDPFALASPGKHFRQQQAAQVGNRVDDAQEQSIDPSLGTIAPSGDLLSASWFPDLDIFGFDFGNVSFAELPTLADMPSPKVDQELLDYYFEYAHPFGPIIHRQRFKAAEPPMCLKYAVWATGALWSTEHKDKADQYYRKARECLEEDEMKGHGETYLHLAHCQSWVLLTWCDAMTHSAVRATMNSRRAIALCQMFGLDRMDSDDQGRRKILPPPKDWIETEERRRTFWAAFCSDRWAAAGQGFSTAMDEKQATSEKAFQEGIEERTGTLGEAYARGFNKDTSYFAAQSVLNLLIGQNMLHLQRRVPSDDPSKTQEELLQAQHKHMDKTLSMLLLTLPPHLQLASNLRDAQVLHLNMTLNGSIISLHLATLARLEQAMDVVTRKRCLQYCFVAAEEVVSCIRLAAHVGVSKLHPFVGFAMFMAAHAYVRIEQEPFNEERNRDCLELILAVAFKLQERHTVLWPLFTRLCGDVDQSKHSHLVHDQYRETTTRLMDIEGKANMPLTQRLKEQPMPGLLPLSQRLKE